jgi:hypothetical protein
MANTKDFLKMTVKEIWPERLSDFDEGVHSFNQYKKIKKDTYDIRKSTYVERLIHFKNQKNWLWRMI